jgi:hypothetical protein
MARARRLHIVFSPGSWLIIAAALLCGWALLYPAPYGLCISLLGTGALAALALPRLSGGYFRLEGKGRQIGAAGQVALYLSMILAIRALVDVDMIDWKGPLLIAGACGLLFAGLGMAADPPAMRSSSRGRATGVALSLFLAGVAFGWGASVEADMLLDRSAPATHRLRVTEKWVVHGRSIRLHLGLAAPNGLGLDNVHVSDWLYTHTQVGEEVCVQSRGGALGFRWYWVERCPPVSVS